MPEYLADLIANRAAREPDKAIFTFLYTEGREQTVSVGELHEDARIVAGILRSEGVKPGEILPLAFDHGYDLVAAFWGAVYLGAVPTILPYLSRDSGARSYLEQVARLVQFTSAPIVVTTRDLEPYLAAGLAGIGCRIAALPPSPFAGPPDESEAWRRRAPSDPAYIQFSSGTTGVPKGVLLSQAAALYYERIVAAAAAASPSDVMVGWLPLYHDMGFTNQLLLPLYAGHSSVLMSPSAWLSEPHRLVQEIHRFRGTATWMPNFAFSYCTRRVRDEQIAGVDLSSWRLVGNASEPVFTQELDAFVRRFAPYGLRREALTISYGLAEHVAAVTHTLDQRAPDVDWVREEDLAAGRAVAAEAHTPRSRAIVGCGPPLETVELRIVDDLGHDLPERGVGEILARSPVVFEGYYGLPEESGVALDNGWLRTGDIGYLACGQLYVCGRKKDLIIVGGRNLHPNHLEEVAAAALGERCRFAAAFGVPRLGTEAPVIVCEMRQLPDAAAQLSLCHEIRERVQQAQQVFVGDICLVEGGWVPKTTSGKINRAASRDKYLFERGAALSETAAEERSPQPPTAPTTTEQRLLAIWGSLFNDERIGIDDDFFDLGGDSLLAAELAIKVEIEFQRIIPATALLDAPTVSTLARLLDRPEPLRPAETLVVLRPMRAAPRHPVFFCVHGLGGGVVGYQTLARALGPEQPFYALQARGLDSAGASRADTSIEDMASHYVDAIRALQPRGPYHLGGYCFGGVVAYEMARQLEAVGDEVALVAVLEGYAPNRTPGHTSRWRDWRSAARMVRTLPYWLRDYLRLERVEMQARNRRLRRVARKRLLQLAGVRVEFDAFDFMDGAAARPARIQHLITTHLAAGRQYSPASYNGRLVLFRTPHVLLRAPQHDMGWGRLASQTVDVQMIAGAHGSILEEPHVRVLAGKLAAYLPPLG